MGFDQDGVTDGSARTEAWVATVLPWRLARLSAAEESTSTIT
jgi:hypothetical protein